MHRKKEEVIQRILAQESLDLELWLERYEFLKFWSYFFVDFSEARDLFVNIFQISGQTAKIPDCRLISEKPEGLSAKSAKSGPQVDFPKVQGPLCKSSEISGIMNYFLTDNSWTGSTSPWTDQARSVHRGPTLARTTGTAARSPELSLRPLWCAKAHRRWRKTEREARGARLEPHRSSGGGVATGRRRWHEEVTGTRRGGVPARERRREGLDEVWGAPGVIGVAFIGPGEGTGGVAGVTVVMSSH
jgi:hypothetical protein